MKIFALILAFIFLIIKFANDNMSHISHIIYCSMENLKLNEETTTLVDNVENAIYDYIAENHLCPGDRLPYELELSEILGVGRNVVREALSRMRSLGILESRKKRGIVLKTLDVTKNFEKIFYPRMLDKGTIVDLLELRLWLEESIIPVVFERISDQDIIELEEILSVEKPLPGGKVVIDNEVSFHSRIFKITRNETILNLQSSLIPVYRYVHDNLDEFLSLCEEGRDMKTTHKDILSALKSRNQKLYRDVISNHLIAYKRYIEMFRKDKEN